MIVSILQKERLFCLKISLHYAIEKEDFYKYDKIVLLNFTNYLVVVLVAVWPKLFDFVSFYFLGS